MQDNRMPRPMTEAEILRRRILGHTDISTTLNIYADVTKELRKSEFDGLEAYFNGEPKNVVNA